MSGVQGNNPFSSDFKSHLEGIVGGQQKGKGKESKETKKDIPKPQSPATESFSSGSIKDRPHLRHIAGKTLGNAYSKLIHGKETYTPEEKAKDLEERKKGKEAEKSIKEGRKKQDAALPSLPPRPPRSSSSSSSSSSATSQVRNQPQRALSPQLQKFQQATEDLIHHFDDATLKKIQKEELGNELEDIYYLTIDEDAWDTLERGVKGLLKQKFDEKTQNQILSFLQKVEQHTKLYEDVVITGEAQKGFKLLRDELEKTNSAILNVFFPGTDIGSSKSIESLKLIQTISSSLYS